MSSVISFFWQATEEFDSSLAEQALKETWHYSTSGYGGYPGEAVPGCYAGEGQRRFVKQSFLWSLFCSVAQPALQHLFAGNMGKQKRTTAGTVVCFSKGFSAYDMVGEEESELGECACRFFIQSF